MSMPAKFDQSHYNSEIIKTFQEAIHVDLGNVTAEEDSSGARIPPVHVDVIVKGSNKIDISLTYEKDGVPKTYDFYAGKILTTTDGKKQRLPATYSKQEFTGLLKSLMIMNSWDSQNVIQFKNAQGKEFQVNYGDMLADGLVNFFTTN